MFDDDSLRETGRSAGVDEEKRIGDVDRFQDQLGLRTVAHVFEDRVEIDGIVEIRTDRVG